MLVLGIVCTVLTSSRVYEAESGRSHDTAHSVVHSRLMMFQELLDKRMAVGSELKTLIFSRGGDISDIDATVQEIFRYESPMVTDIVLAPAGKVSYVYPADGDKKDLQGRDLFADASLKELALYSRDSQRTFLAFSGAAGNQDTGEELFICSPVYLREEGTGYQNFWGFVLVFCPYNTILDESRINELTADNYHYRLLMHSSYGNSNTVIAESDAQWSDTDSEQYSVEEPGYKFILSATPVNGWYSATFLVMVAVVLMLVTILLAVLVIMLFRLNRSNQLLAELSAKDDLTGLPNRRSFRAIIELNLAQEKPLTIFFLDANHFKEVNDTLGHNSGNLVLKEYAARLNEIFDGRAYRLGGDEFAGYVEETMTAEQIEELIGKVNQILTRPFVCSGKKITLSMATGWAVPEKGKTYDQLMAEADALMYESKERFHRMEKANL